MNLVINTAHQRFGGAVQVAYSFINECKEFPENNYIIWLGPGLSKIVRTEGFPKNFSFRELDFGKINIYKLRKIQRLLGDFEKEDEPDVIISTSGPSYFKSRAPQVIGFNLPLYIYPESPFLELLNPFRKFRLWLKKQIHFYHFKRSAEFYVTQTNDVNRRVKKFLKTNKVYTVTNTHNGYYLNPKIYPPRLPKREEKVFRFVTITSYYRHKNLEIIPKVLHELEGIGISNIEFVLTLDQQSFDKVNPLQDQRIINVGPIPPPDCPSLYNECDGMFLPTLAECFSASYPEAMVMEKPIVTTDLAFARSICGDAAHYFNPESARNAAKAIKQLVSEKELRDRLIQNGKRRLEVFDSPRERARKYLNLCERLI